MKQRFVLLILTMFCVTSALFAQPRLPEKCRVFYPDVLLSSVVLSERDAAALEASSDYGQAKTTRNTTFWVVFSDREDNTTYTEPGGSVKFGSLMFNERVRIAQIKDGHALVYTEPQEDIAYPMISQYAKCKGWIPMKNLLLWHSCPANEAGIYNKALLCVNLDEESGADLGKIYKNPAVKTKFDRLKTDMNFYFVMKREGGLALLASNHSMDGLSDQVLRGWVAEQSYVAWNQRSCVEPTWNHKDVEYFADENAPVRIYSDKKLEQCVTMVSFERKASEKFDKHLYRMNPDDLRFPLLDNGTELLYNCSSFGTPGGDPLKVGGKTEDNPEGGSLLGFTENVLNQMTNINIGVVIDGTSSMEAFYPAVKEAIKEGRKFFGDKYKVKVGVVIYRDYGDGEFMTEVFPLTNPDNPRLDQFLNSGGRYGVKSASSDRTLEEALYQGMDVALDRLGFKPDQSNLLLVVGDCGNDRADAKIDRNSIVTKIVDKNVHLMGFQVRNGAEDAFGLFNNQLLYMMKASLEQKYAKVMKGTKIQIVETNDGYKLINDYKSNIYIGSHSYPLAGQSMPVANLSSLMQEAIQYCSESVKFQIDLLAAINGGGFSSSNTESSFQINEEYLKMKLGPERYEQIKKANSLVTFKGYSQKQHKSGRSYFKPVVFISSDELNALIERLAPVNDAAVVQTNNREPYVRAMKALIQSMVPDITDDRMNSMGYKEVMATVAGLNEAAGALKGFTIMEIASPQAVSHTQYASLVSDFKRKFSMLQRLKAQQYKYTRTFNGIKYYWLPVEDLP